MTEPSSTRPATILVLARERDTANMVGGLLQAGHDVRVDWVRDPQALAERTDEPPPDLICVQTAPNGDASGQPHPSAGLRHGNRDDDDDGDAAPGRILDFPPDAAADTPLILLAPGDAGRRAELMRAGASDVVDPEDGECLARVLERELANAARRGEAAEARTRLSRMEMRLDAILAGDADATATVREGVHVRVGGGYANLLGFADGGELENVPLAELVVPEDRDLVRRALAACGEDEAEQPPLAFRARRADDTVLRLSMRLRPIAADGRSQVQVSLSRETPDPGSGEPAAGFPGRFSLYRALNDSAGGGQRGLLYVRIDEIETLQSRIGLSRADQVLNEVSAFLLAETRDADRCVRFEVAELAVLVERADEESLQAAAESLRRAVDGEVFGDEAVSTPLTVTIAVTALGDDGANETRLQHAAQRARELSQAGGNRVEAVTRPQREAGADENADQQMLKRLREALDNDGFALAYQSIASLEGDRKQHYDVLVRLPGGGDESTPLADFADTAGRHGLLPDIDRWIIARVFELQRDRGDAVPMLVTLSADTIAAGDDFLAWLDPQVDQPHTDPACIFFTLRESHVQTNVKRARTLAEQLKKRGFGIALGSYGSTAKSVQLLERLPADFVKLDGELTAAVGSEEENPRLAELLEAASKRKFKIVAEQVQDANSMARLWQLGVNYIASRLVQEPGKARRRSGANVA